MNLVRCCLVLALALAPPALSAQQRSGDAALEARIRALDLAHAQAIFDGDTVALDTLLPDDHTVNHPTNRIVQEKAELLRLIAEGVVRYARFERRPEKFLVYEGLVVVMGDETVVPAAGAPRAGETLRRRYTNGWMRQADGEWRLAFRHANNVLPAADH